MSENSDNLKHSDNNKSQGSVATHLRCGGLALPQNYRNSESELLCS